MSMFSELSTCHHFKTSRLLIATLYSLDTDRMDTFNSSLGATSSLIMCAKYLRRDEDHLACPTPVLARMLAAETE